MKIPMLLRLLFSFLDRVFRAYYSLKFHFHLYRLLRNNELKKW